MPRNIEEYVHRVGRTGRAGRSGTAVTLVCRKDWAIASQLINILTEANQVRSQAKFSLFSFLDMTKKYYILHYYIMLFILIVL